MNNKSDLFDSWLADMQPPLARFEDFVLPTSVRRDFSRESLTELERYLLDRWPDQASFLDAPDTDFIDGAVRYIGETFLRGGGGGWNFSEEPGFAFAGRPFVRLDKEDATPISPYNLMTALLKRRTGQELTRVYDDQLRRIGERRTKEGPNWQPRREPVPGLTDGTDALMAPRPELSSWIDGIELRLTDLRGRVHDGDVGRLDLSPTSLEVLERLALNDFARPEDLEESINARAADEYVAYLGETLRLSVGGDWQFRPGPVGRNPYAGRPYLKRVDDDGSDRTCLPMASLMKLIVEGTPGALVRAHEVYAGGRF